MDAPRRILGRVRPRLNYANVVSTLCLFMLLGGTAVAAATLTGRDIKDGSLRGRDVRNGSLAGRDVKNNGLTSRDVRGLRRADFAPGEEPRDGAQGPKGEAGPVGPPGPTAGRSHSFVCNPTNVADAQCSRVTLQFAQPGRALVLVTGNWHEQAPADGATGGCRVEADGTVVDSRSVGQATGTHTSAGIGGPSSGTLALGGVSAVLLAGPHTFTVECRENDGDLRFQTGLSAVALGAG